MLGFGDVEDVGTEKTKREGGKIRRSCSVLTILYILTASVIYLSYWDAYNIICSLMELEFGGVGVGNRVEFILPSVNTTPIVNDAAKEEIEHNSKNITAVVDENKPYFIFHVGPPKTATTTIQCALHAHASELATLDSYYFLGKKCEKPGYKEDTDLPNNETGIKGHLVYYEMRGQLGDKGLQTNKLKKRMEFHLSKGNHIIFSVERFAQTRDYMVRDLANLLTGWNVRIVITYRRYFDWVPSHHYQNNYHSARSIQSFHNFLEEKLNRWEEMGQNPNFYLSFTAYRRYSQGFDDVRLFDMHAEGDIATRFVCEMIPGAENVCQKMKQTVKHEAPVVERRSSSLDSKIIAQAVFQAGIARGVKWRHVLSVINERLQQINDYKQFFKCLTPKERDRFLRASMLFEERFYAVQKVLPPDGWKLEHEKLFGDAVRQNKFCEVDPQLILQDKEWQKFFSEQPIFTSFAGNGTLIETPSIQSG